MQLFQYSGLLEMKAQELHHDALCLQTAALCELASTNFLNLMENFHGADKTPEEETLGDAASFAVFIATHRKEQEKDEASKSLSKSKSEVEAEEANAGEDNESDEEHSSVSSTSDKPKTLRQKRKTTSAKYPSKCTLA